MKQEKRILRNILYAFAAQGISLLLSVLTSLILPKFFDKPNYGYWSLFLFYTGYTGFFHFGLNDGVYLKIGGTEYADMDKKLLGAQFRFGAMFQSAIGIGIVLWAVLSGNGADAEFVFIMTAVYMLLYNLTLYLGCIFQAANETRLYSMSVMIDKIVFMAAILALFVLGSNDYKVYVWLYMAAKLCAMIYCVYKGREVVFAGRIPMSTTVKETLDSMKIGINLTIANIASNLILGGGRFIIDKYWGIEDFGEVSFSLTLTNFFLLFVSQISMVLFPALRQIDEKRQRELFDMSKHVLNLVLPVVFLVYIPAKELLKIWLPQYEVSLAYMAILLPMCIFDGKMNLVCATYFKVLRKERFLLYVNLFSMALSIGLCAFGAYGIHSIDAIILFMVCAIGVRYFISQIFLETIFVDGAERNRAGIGMAEEMALVVLCAYVCWKLPSIAAFGISTAAYVLYLVLNRASVRYLCGMVKSKIKK